MPAAHETVQNTRLRLRQYARAGLSSGAVFCDDSHGDALAKPKAKLLPGPALEFGGRTGEGGGKGSDPCLRKENAKVRVGECRYSIAGTLHAGRLESCLE